MRVYCTVFEAGPACAAIVAGSAGIRALYLPSSKETVLRKVKRDFPGALMGSNAASREAQELVKRYFKGHRVSFRGVVTDLSSCGKFTRRVLARARMIPYGRVRSYKWAGGGKSRAAGAALAANPVPVIIPCHRIVMANGDIGGFSAGVEWKKRLLGIEGVRSLTAPGKRRSHAAKRR